MDFLLFRVKKHSNRRFNIPRDWYILRPLISRNEIPAHLNKIQLTPPLFPCRSFAMLRRLNRFSRPPRYTPDSDRPPTAVPSNPCIFGLPPGKTNAVRQKDASRQKGPVSDDRTGVRTKCLSRNRTATQKGCWERQKTPEAIRDRIIEAVIPTFV